MYQHKQTGGNTVALRFKLGQSVLEQGTDSLCGREELLWTGVSDCSPGRGPRLASLRSRRSPSVRPGVKTDTRSMPNQGGDSSKQGTPRTDDGHCYLHVQAFKVLKAHVCVCFVSNVCRLLHGRRFLSCQAYEPPLRL